MLSRNLRDAIVHFRALINDRNRHLKELFGSARDSLSVAVPALAHKWLHIRGSSVVRRNYHRLRSPVLRQRCLLQSTLQALMRTLEWYAQALHWLDNPNPDERTLKNVVVRMWESGLKARSVNSYRTAINSYVHWRIGSGQSCGPQCPHPRGSLRCSIRPAEPVCIG